MSRKKSSQSKRLAIVEDMTIYNAAAQKAMLLAGLESSDDIELDLSAVAEIDTAGFQLLVLVKREAGRQGKTARIAAHSACVQEVVDFLDMAAHFGDPILMQSQEAR